MTKYYIGIDLGGTYIKGGIVNESGEIIVSDKTPTEVEKGDKGVAANIAKLAKSLLEKANIELSAVEGLGIGSPGMIDSNEGNVVYANNLGWENFKICDELSRLLGGIKVKIGNDANVAALGEVKFGAARNYNSAVMITLGTGVGGGTLVGLSRKMLGLDTVEHIEQLALSGNLDNVDLRIKDISRNHSYHGINENLTAANFGKVSDMATPSDLALGITNMVAETVAMLAIFAARAHAVKEIVLIKSERSLCSGDPDTVCALAVVGQGGEYFPDLLEPLKLEKQLEILAHKRVIVVCAIAGNRKLVVLLCALDVVALTFKHSKVSVRKV